MDTQKKIELYEEIAEIKKHFQKQILQQLLEKIERVKIDTDGARPSEDYIIGEKEGFSDCRNSVLYHVNKAIQSI